MRNLNDFIENMAEGVGFETPAIIGALAFPFVSETRGKRDQKTPVAIRPIS